MPYPNQHAVPFADRAAFDPETIETKDIAPGVSVIMGTRKGSQTKEAISYRFDADKFSVEQAKAWLKEKKIPFKSFEPATGEQAQEKPKEEPEMPPEGEPKEKPKEDDKGREFDVPFLAPGELTPKSGKPFKLTADEIKRCMEDTNALIADGSLDPPGKLTHDKALADGADQVFGSGALGRIKSLHMMGEVLAAKMEGASEKFADAVRRGIWRNRSAELLRNWKHPLTGKVYPMIVKAISWLGSEMPAVPLRELYGLADGGEVIEVLTDGSQGDGQASIDKGNKPTGDGRGDAPNEQEPTVKTEEEMAEQEKVALAEAQEATQKVTEQLAEMRTKYLTTKLTALVTDRRIRPADVDKHLQMCNGMTEELAEIHLADLKERPQHEDETKPLATTGTPEKKEGELKGEELILAEAGKLFDEGKSGKSYEACIKLAASRNPEADTAYMKQYERGPINGGA
jgi:hypothetical protein